MMGRKLEPLAQLLRSMAEDYVVLDFAEIESVIGELLPPSARRHAAVYWSNSSYAGWAWRSAGFRSTRRGLGPEQVAFVRDQEAGLSRGAGAGLSSTVISPKGLIGPARSRRIAAPGEEAVRGGPDVVLVGCVKTKAGRPCPAKDLYISPLFTGRRRYAERSGRPWFILSAAYGLVKPDEVIQPYEQRVDDLDREARTAWGRQVTSDLLYRMGSLDALVVEIHAGAAYVEAVRASLEAASARLVTPLAGLRLGEQLAWYKTEAPAGASSLASYNESAAMLPGSLQLDVEQIDEREPFSFSWWDGTTETFDRGWDYPVTVEGRAYQVRHGLGSRHVYGSERAHSVTWLDGQVMVEGVAADDYRDSRALLSRLKHPGGHRHIRYGQDVPPGYAGFDVVDHRAELDAPYSPRSLAVKIPEEDLHRWALHAVLRSRHRNAPSPQRPPAPRRALTPPSASQGPATVGTPDRYDLRPAEDRQAVVDALLAHGAELDRRHASDPTLTEHQEANRFVFTDRFAFLVGVICDQGIKAERAWAAPYHLRHRLGHWDLDRIAAEHGRVREAVAQKPALVHMTNKVPKWIVSAAQQVLNYYDGAAAKIWANEPPAARVIHRLQAFDGIGQKKSAMAVELLARILGVSFTDFEGSEIAYDVHVRRVFLRSGLVARDDLGEMVQAARKLHPQHPGLLDFPAWDIGRTWCRPTNPDCQACPIAAACPQLIERGDNVAGM